VRDVDPGLVLFGLSGSTMTGAGERAGLRVAHEVFADRNYMDDGSLVSRRRPDAMVTDVAHAAERVVRMVKEGKVHAVDGQDIAIRADTICIHGDGAHAAEFAKAIRGALERAGVSVQAIGRR
jgi:UPF0271 protein